MKQILNVICAIVTALLMLSCSDKMKLESINEFVMTTGTTIKATNTSGTITIRSDGELKRSFSWNGQTVKVEMQKRQSRWNGSLGIYCPGGGGSIHTVIEEGQQHFNSEKEAIEWLSWQDKAMHYVYSSNGLVVGWHVTKDPNSPKMALSVQVWQFYIKGQMPSKLKGARDDLVSVVEPSVPSAIIKTGKYTANNPKTINNRVYSGKSIDMMLEKGITEEKVEKTIAGGKSEKQGAYTFYYDLSDNKVLWVLVDKDGRVVLVGD